jgi:uncharacterized membrane protein
VSAAATLRLRWSRVSPISSRLAARSLFWPLLAATGASALFFAIAWLRFATYHSSAYDLAFFDQVVWNGARGDGLRSSLLSYPFLGQHFEPALNLFVPLYRLHATPLWLLGAEALALGGAVVPLWALARRWLGGGVRPLVVCAAYLLQVGIARALGFDFHTEALAVPFVFVALLGAARGDTLLLLLAGVAPMLCKEDGALVTLGIAVIALVVHRRRAALVLGGVAVAGGAVVVLGVMPAVRGGASGDLVARYAYLGDSAGGVLAHLVTLPGTWLGHLVSAPSGPALLMALAGVGFLPLLRPVALLASLPALLLPLLAADPYQGGLRLHYALQATPLLVCAAMLGWQRVQSSAHVPRFVPAVALLGGALATWLALSPLPGGHGPDAVHLDGLDRAPAVDALLARIPPGASVAATGDLLTHLAERPAIAEFPSRRRAQWVAIDRRAGVSAQSTAAGYVTAAAHLGEHGYVRVATVAGVELWRLP